VPVTRTYRCKDCEHEFKHFHMDRDEAPPGCPNCAVGGLVKIPGLFSIGTNKGRAIDYAQKMAEEDYGLTNMRDNMRPGDVAAMGPAPEQTAEREAREQQVHEIARAVAAEAPAGQMDIHPVMDSILKEKGGFFGGQQLPARAPGAPASPLGESSGGVELLTGAREQGISSKLPFTVVSKVKG
jgi:hypothetical protein